MFIIKTDSPLFAVSVPHKTFKSFIRATCAMERAIEQRAADYGYTLKKYLFYEVDEKTFAVEYIDEFDIHHIYYAIEIEG